jgi:uncharacterized protein involved in exopolysaccharide biosynthesis
MAGTADAAATRAAQDWAARPRYGLSDYAVMLWRERRLMLIVFSVLFVLGLIVALQMKTTYPARSSVLVRLGQEYVYEPRAGDAGRGAIPDTDALIQAETEILGSAPLKERVIEKLGLSQIYPEMAAKAARSSASEQRKIKGQAIQAMEQSLSIGAAPDTPIIRVTFKHKDPQIAAKVLNTLLEQYLIYRRDVLVDPTSPALDQQRQVFEERLAEADAAYEEFLISNRIGDFVAEKASLSQLQAQIEQQKLQVEAQLQDRQGRLSALQAQLTRTDREIGVYRDIADGGDKLVQLKVQREDLLSRYRPDAQPVRELDAQIAQLQRAIASGRTQGEGARRVGVNPVRQTVETDQIQVAAEVAALKRQDAALAGQLDQLVARRLRLIALEPRFQELSLDRDVLQANVRDFTVRQAQSRAAQEIAARTNDNIRIVERAVAPIRGQSLKRPVAVLALLFAAFTALCAGLLRAFLRPGIPTPQSAARTLGVPVLGAARLKAA